MKTRIMRAMALLALLAGFTGKASAETILEVVYDGNGNVTELLSEEGEIVGRYEYDPFGNTTLIEGEAAHENKVRFSTKRQDDLSGMYYYGFRYYDPKNGRWPNRDPIEEIGGANLYGFVGNSPIATVDRFGLSELPPGAGTLGPDFPGQNCTGAAVGCGGTPNSEDDSREDYTTENFANEFDPSDGKKDCRNVGTGNCTPKCKKGEREVIVEGYWEGKDFVDFHAVGGPQGSETYNSQLGEGGPLVKGISDPSAHFDYYQQNNHGATSNLQVVRACYCCCDKKKDK